MIAASTDAGAFTSTALCRELAPPTILATTGVHIQTRTTSPATLNIHPTRKVFSHMTNEYPDAREVALDDSRVRR